MPCGSTALSHDVDSHYAVQYAVCKTQGAESTYVPWLASKAHAATAAPEKASCGEALVSCCGAAMSSVTSHATKMCELMTCHRCRFAHMIGTREHADHLWRITKDDNQHSHVAQEDLLE